jgi:hypothetical protein
MGRHKQRCQNTVLQLDRNFQPMAEVSRHAAIKAVASGRALLLDPATFNFLDLKTGHTVKLICFPRKREKMQPRMYPGNRGARAIFSRDGHKCCYCGRKVREDATLDHVVPRCQGGQTEWSNLVTACFKCNQKKAGRTPEQAKMTLLWKPVSPMMILLDKLQRICDSAQREYVA